MSRITSFQLNSEVLSDRIDELRNNPTPELLEFHAQHPEHKSINLALIAEYCGVCESTLKNLKNGKIADANASTIWMLCMGIGLNPLLYMGLPGKQCDPRTCECRAIERAEAYKQRLEESEATTQRMRREILATAKTSAAAEAASEHRCKTLIAVSCVAFLMLLLIMYLLIDITHPTWGFFR